MGFTLVKLDVFRKIPRPWFFYTPLEGTILLGGLLFYNKAREHGYDIWWTLLFQWGTSELTRIGGSYANL